MQAAYIQWACVCELALGRSLRCFVRVLCCVIGMRCPSPCYVCVGLLAIVSSPCACALLRSRHAPSLSVPFFAMCAYALLRSRHAPSVYDALCVCVCIFWRGLCGPFAKAVLLALCIAGCRSMLCVCVCVCVCVRGVAILCARRRQRTERTVAGRLGNEMALATLLCRWPFVTSLPMVLP